MKLVSPQGMFQNFSGLLEPLPPPPGLQAASRATAAALTPAPSRLRLVKPDPEGRDAIVGVLSDARLHRPVRLRSSLNCCASRRPWWGTVSGAHVSFVLGPDDCQRGSAPHLSVVRERRVDLVRRLRYGTKPPRRGGTRRQTG